MHKRDFIKSTVVGIIGFFTPKAFANEKQYTQEEKELIMAAALDTPEGKKELDKAINFKEHFHQMLVEKAGGDEELQKVFNDPEFINWLKEDAKGFGEPWKPTKKEFDEVIDNTDWGNNHVFSAHLYGTPIDSTGISLERMQKIADEYENSKKVTKRDSVMSRYEEDVKSIVYVLEKRSKRFERMNKLMEYVHGKGYRLF